MAEYTIGRLAERTGLPVRTIRFYSDAGLLPPSGRTASGYRIYREADQARLELIRTLRDVGFDLPTIRSVLDRDLPVRAAVDLQLRAVEAQLRTLRVARAVLRRALAHGGHDPAEVGRLSTLARLETAERVRLIEDFWAEAGSGGAVDADWLQTMARASIPDLPDDPSDEQLDAWLELAELAVDDDFHAALRRQGAVFWSQQTPAVDLQAWQQGSEEVIAEVRGAVDRGVAPDDPPARPLVDRFVKLAAAIWHRPADARLRADLLADFTAHDPRAERWWELVATLQGGSAQEVRSFVAPYRWLGEALRASAR